MTPWQPSRRPVRSLRTPSTEREAPPQGAADKVGDAEGRAIGRSGYLRTPRTLRPRAGARRERSAGCPGSGVGRRGSGSWTRRRGGSSGRASGGRTMTPASRYSRISSAATTLRSRSRRARRLDDRGSLRGGRRRDRCRRGVRRGRLTLTDEARADESEQETERDHHEPREDRYLRAPLRHARTLYLRRARCM